MEKVSQLKRKIADFNIKCVSINQLNMRVFINNYQTIKYFQNSVEHKDFMESFIGNEFYDVKKPYFVLSYDTYAHSMNDQEILEYIDERLERMSFVDFINGSKNE
jgi:hypothetical protein